WAYSTDPLSGVFVQSLGSDNTLDPAENDYQKEYPANDGYLLNPHDYGLTLDGLMVIFSQVPTAPGDQLLVRLYRMQDGAMVDSESIPCATLSGVIAYPVTFPPDDPGVSDDLGNPFALGNYAAVSICPINDFVYDGECTGNDLHTHPYYFT